ncbi:MAG: REP-associated tyrosine transposase [Gammaproteobacteria bacterium]
MEYRRLIQPGASYFFTVNLANRQSNLLIEKIDQLKLAFNEVRSRHPFKLNAIVILPEHIHAVMTLPKNDSNYSLRWSLIKGSFSRKIESIEKVSLSRKKKRERGIWQRRFWEHLIRDDNDYEKHVNYIHYNPVKHGYVKSPVDWRYSSIHRYIAKGILPSNWSCYVESLDENYGE